MDEEALQIRYPRAYSLSDPKDSCISELYTFTNGEISWNLNIQKRTVQWEKKLVSSMIQLLYTVRVDVSTKRMMWYGF